MKRQAIIFDLDGVLVPTDEYHYQSWVQLAEELGIPFDRRAYDQRMRGLGRAEALDALLEASCRTYSADTRNALATKKQQQFLRLVAEHGLAPAEGAVELLRELRRRCVKIAVGSSSRNARFVLSASGLDALIDVVVDGNDARSKPQPDIFLRAAELLGVEPDACVVVEDAFDGLEAARRCGMAAVAIGPAERLAHAAMRVNKLSELTADILLLKVPATRR